ncbi:hypothetical protein D3C71_1588660 [compost metagenome]
MTMKPPSGGPITGPSSAGMDRKDMAFSRSCLGTVRSRMIRPTGTIIAPAIPWMIRATTSWGRSCESAQAMELSVNRPMAATNTLRAPYRSAAQPLTGTKTATDSR